jgi:hypothetical protein
MGNLLLLQNLVEIFTNQRKICHIFKVKNKLIFRGQQRSLQRSHALRSLPIA